MAKASPESQLDESKRQQYEAELREFYRGDYPTMLMVKGERIAKLREWLGKHEGRGKPISQEELATRAGLLVDQATIQRYEKKYKEAPTIHLWAIARAFGVALHEVAYTSPSLPPPMPATALYRAKVFLIRSWLLGTLPKDPTIDLRHYVDKEWRDPHFRELISLTKNQEQILWHSLAQDGWVAQNAAGEFFFQENHRLPPTPAIFFRLGIQITHLAMEIVTIEHAAYANIIARIEHCLQSLAKALLDAQEALRDDGLNLELALEALRDCDLALADTDTVAPQVTLLHHAAFAQWVDASVAMVTAAQDGERFNLDTFLRPVLQILYHHREQLFYLLRNDPANLAAAQQLELQYRQAVFAYLAKWSELRHHLAELGLLSEATTPASPETPTKPPKKKGKRKR